jgi:hypothetical protein
VFVFVELTLAAVTEGATAQTVAADWTTLEDGVAMEGEAFRAAVRDPVTVGLHNSNALYP